MKEPFIVIQTTDNWEEIQKKEKKRKKDERTLIAYQNIYGSVKHFVMVICSSFV